jgi:L-seryl-tRNA(Ser) seleniumtransferase
MSASRNNNGGFAKYLKNIPSKSLSLEFIRSGGGDFFNRAGERLILSLLDGATEKCRQNILLGVYPEASLTRENLCAEIWRILKSDCEEKIGSALSLVNVINATGIVIHTNLGRAPLTKEFDGFDRGRYCNLEFDLETGLRGRRDDHLNALLAAVTGAEDAICVNNNAAAVLLISAALAGGGEILVRRGESVEIGEGFRINEMMKAGGARVVDIGATNSCNLADCEKAITPESKIAARIHTSNYRVSGYVKSLEDAEFLEFCRRYALVSYYDLGSGLLKREIIYGKDRLTDGEPAVCGIIEAGFDLVSFSCDKLLGGPQAGVICGKKDLIAALRKHQMYRALRVSKEIIATLQSAIAAYLFSDHAKNIPVVKMLNDTPETIGARCISLIEAVRALDSYKTAVTDKNIVKIEIAPARAAAGGGTTPEKTLANPAVHIRLDEGAPKNVTLEYVAREMRMSKQRVVGYIDSDSYILNLRTVFDGEIEMIAKAVDSLLQSMIKIQSN